MTDMPEPLVPGDVDLSGYRWMKLDLARLFNSDFFALATGDEFRAGVTLWGKAMYQQPAGTLPDDDRTLAALAGYGRDVKGWQKVRAMALRGWFRASDGRLHHQVVAEMVLEAWRERVRYRADQERLKRWREARRNGGETRFETQSETGDETPSETQSETRFETRRQGQRQGQRQGRVEREEGAPAAQPPATPPPDPPVAPDGEPLRAAVDAWNELADQHGLPRVQALTVPRQRALRRRLADAGGLDGWRTALAKVAASRFLTGANDRGWRADFDFVTREAAFTRLMEGKYDDQQRRDGEQFRNGFARLVAEGGV